jgi:GH35 family endo-1,4-beta-xylanase
MICLTLLSLLIMLAIPSGGNVVLLDDFEQGEKWKFSNGPEFPGATGSFSTAAMGAYSGKLGGVLSFDFTHGGNYVQASIKIPEGVEANSFEFFLRKPCKNTVTVRVTDSEGQTFQKSFNLTHQAWQKVRVKLGNWTGYWGGKGDGIFRGKPTEFGILVENDAPLKTGKIFFDDVKAILNEQEPIVSTSEYEVSNFSSGWYLRTMGDGGTSCFQSKKLTFDFTKGAKEIGIQNEIALMGSPIELRLDINSLAKGTQVVVRIYSHFQAFEKVIGDLNGTGFQTLTAPLGSMHEWQHFGGENDGIVRWPLRLTNIFLRQGSGPKSGKVEFISVRIKTSVSTNSAIVLVPTAKSKNGTAHFACDLINLMPKSSEGTLYWIVTTYDGRIVSSGDSKLKINPTSKITFNQDVPQEKHVFLECQFQYVTDTCTYGPVSTCSVYEAHDFWPTLKSADRPKPTDIFGMGLYLYRYPNTPEGFAQMERAAKMAATAGVKWSREEFNWARIEPVRGEFNWEFYDRMVDIAEKYGIQIYGLISYWSNWTKPNTLEGIEDYAEYCKALVSRYKDKIKHWEVWNEPNIFFWTGPKEMYANLLKTAYKAIKEADPEAQVLGCSTSGIDTNFIKMVIEKGAPFDALTIHPYRRTLDDEHFIRELQDVSRLTVEIDGKAKPVWITEMGWTTEIPHGVSEREQASLLARTYLCAAASGVVSSVSWYDFKDDGDCPFYGEHRHGIVRTDLSPKPAYLALKTITHTVGGKRLEEKVSLGTGILAYKFSDGEQDTLAIWSLDKDVVLNLSLRGKNLTTYNLMGSATPLKERESIVVLKANEPVFILGQGISVLESKLVPIDYIQDEAPVNHVSIKLRNLEAIRDINFHLQCPPDWVVTRRGENFDIRISEQTPRMFHHVVFKITKGTQTHYLPIKIRIPDNVLEV